MRAAQAAAVATEPQDGEKDLAAVRPRVTRARRLRLVPPVDPEAELARIAGRISRNALEVARLALDLFAADPATIAAMPAKLQRLHHWANLPRSKAPAGMVFALRYSVSYSIGRLFGPR